MTRIVLAFMLVLAVQTVYADVLIIDEVRQAETHEFAEKWTEQGHRRNKIRHTDRKDPGRRRSTHFELAI